MPASRREKLLEKAVRATNAEFGVLAVEMPLPWWLQACRARMALRPESHAWTRERWEQFEAEAQAVYFANCAYLSGYPHIPAHPRPDTGRLYSEESRR